MLLLLYRNSEPVKGAPNFGGQGEIPMLRIALRVRLWAMPIAQDDSFFSTDFVTPLVHSHSIVVRTANDTVRYYITFYKEVLYEQLSLRNFQR